MHLVPQPKLKVDNWTKNIDDFDYPEVNIARGRQLKAIGNAQSPFVAASAFRILVNRHIMDIDTFKINVSDEELARVFQKQETWIAREHPEIQGLVHTPTTIANYSTPSMQKHQGCRNFVAVFGRPSPKNGEYLMGFPIGASYPKALCKNIQEPWCNLIP